MAPFDMVGKAVAPLKRRILNMIARAVLSTIQDDGDIQTVQISLLADEVKSLVQRIQNYGLSAHPLPGAQAVVAFLNGNRDQGAVVACDDGRHRPKNLAEGEVYLYTDLDSAAPATGQHIHFKRDKITEIVSGTRKITLDEDTGKITIDNGGQTLELDGTDLTITTTGTVTIGGATEVNLQTGDAAAWLPNILPNCLFTNAPHGGPVGGIVKLKGS